MLKKPIEKASKSKFHSFIQEKTQQAQLKKAENLKKGLLNPDKANNFKDLRTFKNKVHTILDPKSSKKKKFDLNSDDENIDTNILRHKGQEIEKLDDFNEEIEASSIEDDEINKEIVNELHFGGFENEAGGSKPRKTKQEIYKEIIKKSKKMRYEKQKLREENLNRVDEIDQDSDTMKKIFGMKLSKEERKAKQPIDDEDDYDQLARDLLLDGKTYAKKDVSIKDPKQLKKDEKRREKKKERIFSDEEESEEREEEEDEDVRNDDELEEKVRGEKRGIGYEFDKRKRKTEKLNAFLNELQEIKRKKLEGEDGENSDEDEDDEDLEPSEEEEEEDYEESDNE